LKELTKEYTTTNLLDRQEKHEIITDH